MNKLNKDLDIVRLIDTIYKIKATLKVFVADNQHLMNRILKIYHDDKLIKTKPMASDYADFLEEDHLFELKRRLAELRMKKLIFEALKPEKRERGKKKKNNLVLHQDYLTQKSVAIKKPKSGGQEV